MVNGHKKYANYKYMTFVRSCGAAGIANGPHNQSINPCYLNILQQMTILTNKCIIKCSGFIDDEFQCNFIFIFMLTALFYIFLVYFINYVYYCYWMIVEGIIIGVIVILGVLTIVHRKGSFKNNQKEICIILGSGGHTTEMCELFRKFNFQGVKNVFVLSGNNDKLSQSFWNSYFEEILDQKNKKKIKMYKTKRTNEVKQSKITSILSTLLAFLNSFVLIISKLKGVTHLISNGPGICVPFFVFFWFFNKLSITNTKLIFVQSWCRVSTLSVAGKISSYFASEYLVHWQKQVPLAKNTKYFGQII